MVCVVWCGCGGKWYFVIWWVDFVVFGCCFGCSGFGWLFGGFGSGVIVVLVVFEKWVYVECLV